jgi:RHH-type proline utilization regulon transcriptional repressor/proline dehydrogenase/delta 1-pyrroline-5-carboxylate dehydrogenase
VADRMITMITGAARELKLGDPADPSVQIGPVIDREAKDRLDAHIARMRQEAVRTHYEGAPPAGQADGLYVAPHIFEIGRPENLGEEVFGPILHVVRYRAGGLKQVIAAIEASGYGLTLGIHTRIDDAVETVIADVQVGNIYVNRNMIGAVVGVQPFGGHGLSGTGPKAGGPYYLLRFATEQTVTINTAAAGGNAGLLSLADLVE